MGFLTEIGFSDNQYKTYLISSSFGISSELKSFKKPYFCSGDTRKNRKNSEKMAEHQNINNLK
jgi:hypothetical protein